MIFNVINHRIKKIFSSVNKHFALSLLKGEQLFPVHSNRHTHREKNGLALVSHAIDKSTSLNTIIRHERKKNAEAILTIFTKVVVFCVENVAGDR